MHNTRIMEVCIKLQSRSMMVRAEKVRERATKTKICTERLVLCYQSSQSSDVRYIQVRGYVCLESSHLSWKRQFVLADFLRLGRKKQMVITVVSVHARSDDAQDLGRYRCL